MNASHHWTLNKTCIVFLLDSNPQRARQCYNPIQILVLPRAHVVAGRPHAQNDKTVNPYLFFGWPHWPPLPSSATTFSHPASPGDLPMGFPVISLPTNPPSCLYDLFFTGHMYGAGIGWSVRINRNQWKEYREGRAPLWWHTRWMDFLLPRGTCVGRTCARTLPPAPCPPVWCVHLCGSGRRRRTAAHSSSKTSGSVGWLPIDANESAADPSFLLVWPSPSQIWDIFF